MSFTKSGQRKKLATSYDDDHTIAQCIAALDKWDRRVREARCPRCGKRVGEIRNGVAVVKRLHCPKCRARRMG